MSNKYNKNNQYLFSTIKKLEINMETDVESNNVLKNAAFLDVNAMWLFHSKGF
jgi:hypothetical protein